MVLYACASCILGWTGMTRLACEALRVRGLDAALSPLLRLLVMLACTAGAMSAWLLFDSAVPCLALSFAWMCMAALLACDLREHILPTELVALVLACAVVFRLSVGGLADLAWTVVPAALFAGMLLVLNHLRMNRGAGEIIGSGDVRMIVPLVLLTAGKGMLCGMFACASFMGIIALVQLASGRARIDSGIALAPGLAAWLLVGTLASFL